MEHTANSQDRPDTVPLSSSPVTTSDSEGGVAVSEIGEVPTSSPEVIKEESSSMQLATHVREDATGTMEVLGAIFESNLPLLSPFAVLKSGSSSTYEDIRVQSVALQRALHTIPDSPPEPMEDSSSSVSNVLRSPFGVHLKSASSFSDDLFLPSPQENLFMKDQMITDNQDAEGSHKNANGFSDSGESAVGPPSTPKASKIVPRIVSSSPYVATSMSADTTYIKNDKHHIQNIARDLSLTLELSTSKDEDPSRPEDAESEAIHLSRSLSPDSHSCPTATPALSLEISEPGEMAVDSPGKRGREADEKELVPAPKRMTLASQQRQYKKLASPFRSPLLSKPSTTNIPAPAPRQSITRYSSPLSSSLISKVVKPSTPINKFPHLVSTSARSQTPLSSSAKAKAPFKSPIVKSSPTTTSLQISNPRTIQDLERKVQLLKRAIKIKNGGEEEKLEQLVKKWRTAGREAAWELWQIVRDNEESAEAPYPGTNSKSQGTSYSGWGWASTSGTTQMGNWGWDSPAEEHIRGEDVDSDELESPTKVERELFDALSRTPAVPRKSMLPPTPRGAYYEQRADDDAYDAPFKEVDRHGAGNSQDEAQAAAPSRTLGAMLHRLGIAHETLGWVEDEGDFVDN